MVRGRGPWYDPDPSECDWCQRKYKWRGRPCMFFVYPPEQDSIATRRRKREMCERVRAENAVWRKSRTMPRALRAVARIVAAAEAGHGGIESPTEETKHTEIQTDSGTMSNDSPITNSTPTHSIRDNKTFEVRKAQQPRQSKACTGDKSVIHEGLSLALHEDEDVARILDANRKAWPRGQAPIAANATPEDKEIAELVRSGLIAPEELAINRWEDDVTREPFCPYTVRFIQDRRRHGQKQKSWLQHEPGYVTQQEQQEDSESDWWYLDDESFDQLLRDGEFDFEDGSQLSFVYVD